MRILSLQLFPSFGAILKQSAAYVCGGDPGNGDLYCGADVCCKGDGSEVCYDYADLNVYTGGCNPVVYGIYSVDVFPYPTTATQVVATSYYVESTTTVYTTAYSSGVDTSYYSNVAYETTTLTITEAGPTATITEREIVKRITTLITTQTFVHTTSTEVIDYTISSGYVSTVTLGTTLPIVNTQVIGQTTTQLVTEMTTTTEDGTTITIDRPASTPTAVENTQTTPSDTPSTAPSQPSPTTPTTVVTSATAQESSPNAPVDAGPTASSPSGPSVVTVTAANSAAQSSQTAAASSSPSGSTNAANRSIGQGGGAVWLAAVVLSLWVYGRWQ
ncbi:hypothetical protein PRZ48_003175 [Zasmidium cellare]|uniref:Uncharacterized protein n=1 Tax=Zasmidium cellare TaxID=395010 RepID=A0ABR0EUF1_ZASCE|nr:hypothetical protein PRZ48_003175 [Zasmidium cellare]